MTRIASIYRLWLGQTARRWGSVGGAQYGVQRIDYDGETIPFEMKTVSVQASGFEIEFTKPVDEVTAGDTSNYDLSHWGYDNDEGYGSPRLDETSIASGDVTATVSDDERTVTLDLPGLYLTPDDAAGMIGGTRVYELATSGIQSSDGESLEHPNAWYTLNTLPEGAVTLSRRGRRRTWHHYDDDRYAVEPLGRAAHRRRTHDRGGLLAGESEVQRHRNSGEFVAAPLAVDVRPPSLAA